MKLTALKELEALLVKAEDVIIDAAIEDPKYHALRVKLGTIVQDVTMDRIRAEQSENARSRPGRI